MGEKLTGGRLVMVNFNMSTQLGHGAQICGQILFWKFLDGVFG